MNGFSYKPNLVEPHLCTAPIVLLKKYSTPQGSNQCIGLCSILLKL